MSYTGDQDHWYGPGEHAECPKCGYCKDCGVAPKGRVVCSHHTEKRSEQQREDHGK